MRIGILSDIREDCERLRRALAVLTARGRRRPLDVPALLVHNPRILTDSDERQRRAGDGEETGA
jgi:hypothetical protein